MRHVLIRGIMGLIWLAAAVVSGVSGNLGMAVLYLLLGVVFWYFAYAEWKKKHTTKGADKNENGSFHNSKFKCMVLP